MRFHLRDVLDKTKLWGWRRGPRLPGVRGEGGLSSEGGAAKPSGQMTATTHRLAVKVDTRQNAFLKPGTFVPQRATCTVCHVRLRK